MKTIKGYYGKRLAILLSTWIVLGGTLGYLSTEYSPAWLIAVFALQIALGITVIKWRCPKCKHAILQPAATFSGTKIYYWSCWVPNECGNCGLNFYKTPFNVEVKTNAP